MVAWYKRLIMYQLHLGFVLTEIIKGITISDFAYGK